MCMAPSSGKENGFSRFPRSFLRARARRVLYKIRQRATTTVLCYAILQLLYGTLFYEVSVFVCGSLMRDAVRRTCLRNLHANIRASRGWEVGGG